MIEIIFFLILKIIKYSISRGKLNYVNDAN